MYAEKGVYYLKNIKFIIVYKNIQASIFLASLLNTIAKAFKPEIR